MARRGGGFENLNFVAVGGFHFHAHVADFHREVVFPDRLNDTVGVDFFVKNDVPRLNFAVRFDFAFHLEIVFERRFVNVVGGHIFKFLFQPSGLEKRFFVGL